MDDRRFDSLVKRMASGTSRRSLFKGLLGLGGAAAIGGTIAEGDASAARRPTPAPKLVTCPGQQIWDGSVCVCPEGLSQCGPDCCNSSAAYPGPGYSECCDNACCNGTCYGDELCCLTNLTGAESPPLEQVCTSANSTECCPYDHECCPVDGCCETFCDGGGRCCSERDFCSGGGERGDLCCTDGKTCCVSGTGQHACVDLLDEGNCCDDGDCRGGPCQMCNVETHTCEALCGEGSTCCAEESGGNICQLGACCSDGSGCMEDVPYCCGGETKACCELECDSSGECPLDCRETGQFCADGNECCTGFCCGGYCSDTPCDDCNCEAGCEGCESSGGTCLNGGCYYPCTDDYDCESVCTASCWCDGMSGVEGLFCQDISRNLGDCAITERDCPDGTACSNLPTKDGSHLCLQPCCFPDPPDLCSCEAGCEGCEASGGTCLNGGCYYLCAGEDDCDGGCTACSCERVMDVNGHVCLDIDTVIGLCATAADCPVGAACMELVSGTGSGVCYQPCCRLA